MPNRGKSSVLIGNFLRNSQNYIYGNVCTISTFVQFMAAIKRLLKLNEQ